MRCTGLQDEHPGFYSSIDYFFARLLTFASYIQHRFIRFIGKFFTLFIIVPAFVDMDS